MNIQTSHKKILKSYAVDCLIVFVIVILFFASSSVYADSVKPISSANSGYIFQVFVGLVIVIAMIFAVAALAKRFGAGGMLNNQHMKIVSSLSLGQKEKIIVIEAGERQLLLGVTAQQITNLYVFDESIIDLKTKKEMSDFTQKIHGFLTQQPSIKSKKKNKHKNIETHEADDESTERTNRNDSNKDSV